jgi:predicted Holliday junction resolvase-like endonuclease
VARINEKFRLDMEARLGPLMLAREDMLKQHSAAVEELKRVMGLNAQTMLEKYSKEAKQRQDLAIARQIASSQERINGIRAEEQQKREETLREAARRLDEVRVIVLDLVASILPQYYHNITTILPLLSPSLKDRLLTDVD